MCVATGHKAENPAPGARRPEISVVIASRGRPELLSQTVQLLHRQTLAPARIILSCASPSDVAINELKIDDRYRLVVGRCGLAAQRNVALTHVPETCDYVVFFDDDFIADDGWLEAVATVFERDPAIYGLTGDVIADGIKGRGINLDEASRLLAAHKPPTVDWLIEGYSPYGCNMAYRWSAARQCRFDERLVLYGWQEDRDYGARIAQCGGRLAKIGSAFGVHLGAKAGRGSGRRLGYSQVVNPLYLNRKGTMTAGAAFQHIARNVLSNLARSVAPEPFVDRRGRLSGNLIAMREIATGCAQPERAELF